MRAGYIHVAFWWQGLAARGTQGFLKAPPLFTETPPDDLSILVGGNFGGRTIHRPHGVEGAGAGIPPLGALATFIKLTQAPSTYKIRAGRLEGKRFSGCVYGWLLSYGTVGSERSAAHNCAKYVDATHQTTRHHRLPRPPLSQTRSAPD